MTWDPWMWRNNHCSPEFNGIWKAQCKQWFPIMPKEGLEHCLVSPDLNTCPFSYTFYSQGWRVRCYFSAYSLFSLSPSPVRLFATPQTAARQASLSLTISQSLPTRMSIASVMPAASSSFDALSSFCPQSSHHQGLVQWVSCFHQVQLQLQHESFQWVFRIYFP